MVDIRFAWDIITPGNKRNEKLLMPLSFLSGKNMVAGIHKTGKNHSVFLRVYKVFLMAKIRAFLSISCSRK